MTREIINGVVRLTADSEKWLTNGSTNSKQVYIGRLCNESDWTEVEEPINIEEVTDSDKAEAYDILTGGTT